MDEQERLKKYIDMAFDELYKKDSHLIANRPNRNNSNGTHHVGERAIVFRFAYYLQNLLYNDDIFKEYHLDCEYNRNGIETKNLPGFPDGTFPDLIIHKRGSNESNLLVMEFKTYWNSNQEKDKQKIAQFMDPKGKYRYKYGIAALITPERLTWDWE